jgi:hypothetical protein
MDEHEKILKDFGRSLGELLKNLLVPEASLPRPVISLKGDMPLLVPVNQDTLRALETFVHDHRPEFHEAIIIFHVQPYKDPYQRKTVTVPYPYTALASGENITRLDDPRPVTMARVIVPQVPAGWRSKRMTPLEVIIQAQAKHVRHGTALGIGPIAPYRVPRQEITGKATGL